MSKIIRACRGDGVAFIEVAEVSSCDLVNVLTAEGNSLPSSIVAITGASCAISFPLARTTRYEIRSARGLWSFSIGAFELALRSKFTYAFQRGAAERLRDSDLKNDASCLSVRFVQVIEDGDESVVRARVDIPQFVSKSAKIDVMPIDNTGATASFPIIFMEDCRDALNEKGRAVRRVTLSMKLPIDRHCVGVSASVSDGSCQPGGCVLLDDTYNALRAEFSDSTLDAACDPRYHDWWEQHRAGVMELCAQSRCVFERPSLFSIVVPLFCTPIKFFDEMYDSVLGQSYSNWELILVNASPDDEVLSRRLSLIEDERVIVVDASNEGIAQNTNVGIRVFRGDYLCFLDHDDMLAPDALYEYAITVEQHPDTDLIYCDEDRFYKNHKHATPFFKPDYSPELLQAYNYITHFLCVSKACVDKIGLMDSAFNGAQDYDYTLRATECARRVSHVPRVLYHWRIHEGSTSANPESKSYAKNAGLQAVKAHCERMGFKASVECTDMPFAYRVVHDPRDWGCVDIVIPTKDHSNLLCACVESILELSTYQNYRIIIVENGSVETETFACYERLQTADDRVRIVEWAGEFNYSKIVNFGADQGDGSYILFLNNDTQVISPDFLDSMLGCFEDGGVGVVGAKLLYADGTVQHAGVGIGLLGSAAHLFTSLPATAGGYFERARSPQNLSAVTGACQLVSRAVYDEVGGYTEEFAIGYNDIDFCLKTRSAGYRTVYMPYALLSHFEFSSRGRDVKGARKRRANQEAGLLHARWEYLFERGDPYLNPNLSKDSCYFALAR